MSSTINISGNQITFGDSTIQHTAFPGYTDDTYYSPQITVSKSVINTIGPTIGVPPGVVIPYVGILNNSTTIINSGYLVCDGGIYSKADYSTLNSVLGGIYDISSIDSTQFQVPDMRGRFCIGGDQSSGHANYTDALNATANITGGNDVMLTNQLASHEHNVNMSSIMNDTTQIAVDVTHPENATNGNATRKFVNYAQLPTVTEEHTGGTDPYRPPCIATHFIIKY